MELLKREAMVSVAAVVTIVIIAGLELPGSIYEMLNIVSCHDDSLGDCQRRVCSLITPSARQLDTMQAVNQAGKWLTLTASMKQRINIKDQFPTETNNFSCTFEKQISLAWNPL